MYHTDLYPDDVQFFNVVEQGSFHICVEPCRDITQLNDYFITREKLEQEYNAEWGHHFVKNSDSRFGGKHYPIQYKRQEIIDLIDEWVELMPEGAATTTKANPRIRSMIHSVPTGLIKELMPAGYSIKGSRIQNIAITEQNNKAREERKFEEIKKREEARKAAPYERVDHPRQGDVYSLITACKNLINIKYKISIKNPYYSYGRNNNAFNPFYKRLLNWNEVKKHIREKVIKERKRYVKDIIQIKRIWDNPDIEYQQIGKSNVTN